MIDYSNGLLESVLEAYTGIIQSLGNLEMKEKLLTMFTKVRLEQVLKASSTKNDVYLFQFYSGNVSPRNAAVDGIVVKDLIKVYSSDLTSIYQ